MKINTAVDNGTLNLLNKVVILYHPIFNIYIYIYINLIKLLKFLPQFFDMQRHDAVRALEIYRKAGQQVSSKSIPYQKICLNKQISLILYFFSIG